MNDILKSLYARQSVRVFQQKEIPPEVRHQLIESAAQAPTAGNQQFYTILDITDQSIKDRLADLCDHQPFIAKAPLVFIFLADQRRWLDCYRWAGIDARNPGPGDLMLAVADAVIAAQNTVVAAESLGVGSCYIGDICEHEETIRDMLCLDEYTFPAAMVVYGYPEPGTVAKEKRKRLEQEYFVFENTYRRLSEEEHRRSLEQRGNLENTTFESFLQSMVKRRYHTEFNDEMNRSTTRYWKHFLGE